jgi:peptide-methionine (S)-S-oxide reductase
VQLHGYDKDKTMTIATFSAGCFWGVEEKFRQFHGVLSTRVGYTAGHTNDPVYKTVCTGNTGHAEAIEITFDPTLISYEDLLDIFWKIHNPTTLNSQGPDIGSQYRSGIFYHDHEQKQQALDKKQALNQSHFSAQLIVTEITPASHFYSAEAYHQCYIEKQKR